MYTKFFSSILVLKDGQIVETGSFRELLAQNGIFATMWADQVSADDELVDRSSVQKEAHIGYVVDVDNKLEEGGPQPSREEPPMSAVASPEPHNPFADPIVIDFVDDIPATESPQTRQIDLSNEPSADNKATEAAEAEAQPEVELSNPNNPFDQATVPSISGADAQLTIFPSSETTPDPPAVLSPIDFPSSAPVETPTSPGVTFGAGVDTPTRSGTPDPEGKPKRIRKTSQNIQKLARTLSFAARRQSSGTGSSVTKVETGSPRTSREDSSATRGEGSVGGDSTEASVGSADKKETKGKGKKSKKGRSGTK